jgi:hypothetical protein
MLVVPIVRLTAQVINVQRPMFVRPGLIKFQSNFMGLIIILFDYLPASFIIVMELIELDAVCNAGCCWPEKGGLLTWKHGSLRLLRTCLPPTPLVSNTELSGYIPSPPYSRTAPTLRESCRPIRTGHMYRSRRLDVCILRADDNRIIVFGSEIMHLLPPLPNSCYDSTDVKMVAVRVT